jgi:hypothetical protein
MINFKKRGELSNAIRDLLTAPGRSLTPHEIAKELNANIKTVLSIQWAMNHPAEHAIHKKRANLKAQAKYRKMRRMELSKQEKAILKQLEATPSNGVQLDMFEPIVQEAKEQMITSNHAVLQRLNEHLESMNVAVFTAPPAPAPAPPVVADVVNNPAHYTVGGISVFDFIDAKKLSYGRGNVIKYVTRAGVKDPATELQDLEKAQWYLAAEIDRLKGKK